MLVKKITDFDYIKTKIWCGSVKYLAEYETDRKFTYVMLVNLLSNKFDTGAIVNYESWSRYFAGKMIPYKNTRSQVEECLPGTIDIFEYGPEFSFLCDAINDSDPKSVISSIINIWSNAKIIQLWCNVNGFVHLVPRLIPEDLFKLLKIKQDRYLDLADHALCLIHQDCLVQIKEEYQDNPILKVPLDLNLIQEWRNPFSLHQMVLPELTELSLKIANARLDKKNQINLEFEPSHLEIYGLTLENITTITGIHFDINN